MRNYCFLLLAFVCVTSLRCSGQHNVLPEGYSNWYIGDFRCGVYVPPSYYPARKYPLVIYLHGHTDTVSRNIGWYHEPAALADPAIVLTPKCPVSEDGRWGDTSSKELSPMMEKTFEMIDIIRKKYNIDEQRLYIHGTSMGAIGTYAVIKKFPDMFAGAYAVCGWASRSIAPQLSRVPFWAFHGEEDPVVPVAGSRGIYEAVLSYGGKQIRYTEFKGVKHDAWNYVNDNDTYKWLLAQRKGLPDGGPPGTATDLRARVLSDKNVLLEWSPPRDEKDLWYYKIYRDNILVGEAGNNVSSFTDLNATESNAFNYKISVVNYYFKESDQSARARVTRNAD
jgi:poly(3-hydroxybutyrate) depolymerase